MKPLKSPEAAQKVEPKRRNWSAFNFVKRNKLALFLVSLIVLLLSAYIGAKEHGVQDIQNALVFELPFEFDFDFDFDLDSLTGNLPLGLANILSEVKGETSSRNVDTTGDFVVGKYMKKENFSVEHPVVMIPGIISTGLESWGLEGTPECPSEPHFRKRLWGSFYMLKAMFLNKNCWLKHIMLDTETGLDPPHFKLRAAQGFEAADFFITGYWIWNKIVSNLAVLGYEPNEMTLASYDWRLAYSDLEVRDQYFTKLKNTIEVQHRNTGRKSVLIGHSMGSQVAFYFLKWVEAMGPTFGNGGPNWVNDHIESFVDISGSSLGTPKAISALISGEMSDTVQLNAVAVYGLEKFFSRKERLDLLRTLGGVASVIPKGGDTIWGNLTFAPDDTWSNKSSNSSYGSFLKFNKHIGAHSAKNLTVAESIDYMLKSAPQWFVDRVLKEYSFGLSTDKAQLKLNNQDPSKWSNPLEAALPHAPDMKIFCFYGMGIPAERSYMYQEEETKDETKLNVTMAYGEKDTVLFTDGDGTLPLVSHTMCHKWQEQDSVYNPSGIDVRVVELKHEPGKYHIRGGSKTSEHVDILGSTELNELIIKVVSGKDYLIKNRVTSQIGEFIKNMKKLNEGF